MRQTESIFERWGAPSLMFAKFVPGFASVATAMAGVVRLPLWRFVLFDAIGAALWSGVAIALGYVFRDAINEVLAVFEALGRIGSVLHRRARSSLYVVAKWCAARSASSGSCGWTGSPSTSSRRCWPRASRRR